ncbi:uncharacterized protein LOC5508998 [Nematostella vectensis]|uniref:uncharacterized protein LOC5508998 n=1 Tax=Nematostella vectensis TaxID=45351 RepID=UPI002077395E|nr:uncharacterized protein LOC5508998 [Nematostella vectensis]
MTFYLSSTSSAQKTTRIRLTKTVTETKVQQWEKYLTDKFEGKIQPKPAKQVYLKDAWSVFGGAKLKKRLTLRTSAQTIESHAIALPQFDPNFYAQNDIQCRMAGCKETKPRAAKRGCKEDLYLCSLHQERLRQHVKELCSKSKVDVDFNARNDDFEGYTSLIWMMDRAYFFSIRKNSQMPRILKECPKIMNEVWLNIRNFMLITNAVLNPIFDNCRLALPPVMDILREILEHIHETQYVENLVYLMRSIVEMILFAFGVIYTWVSLALLANPGAQIGMGVGGVLGAAAAGAAAGPVGVAIGFGLGLGAFCGGLIGGGYYNWQQQQREQLQQDEALRRYRDFMRMPAPDDQPQPGQPQPVLYQFRGDAWGGFVLTLWHYAEAFGN